MHFSPTGLLTNLFKTQSAGPCDVTNAKGKLVLKKNSILGKYRGKNPTGRGHLYLEADFPISVWELCWK